MKKIFFLGLLLLVTAFTFTALAAAPEVPADGVQMNRTATKNKKIQDIVLFNHSTHTDYKCVDCHHMVDGKEDYRSCATAGCHDKLDQKDKSVNSYYAIAHKRSGAKFETCASCHNKVLDEKYKGDKAKKDDLTSCNKSKCHQPV